MTETEAAVAPDPRNAPEQEVVDKVRAYMAEITEAALAHGLLPDLVAAVVAQESGGDAWAARYEPGYRWLVWEVIRHPIKNWRRMSQPTREIMQKTSWGLMQVMGGVAVEDGLQDWPHRMCEPALGLEFGCKHLAKKLKQADGDEQRALLLWNGGKDKEYPSKVDAWRSCFK